MFKTWNLQLSTNVDYTPKPHLLDYFDVQEEKYFNDLLSKTLNICICMYCLILNNIQIYFFALIASMNVLKACLY